MFTRYFMSKHLLPMVKYTTSAFLLVCLVVVQGFAENLSEDTPKTNLSGNEDININTYTLTLDNTADSEYSGILSGSGQVVVTKNGWNASPVLTLSPANGYADFTGSVTIQEGYTTEHEYAEGRLKLSSANIFNNASSITNGGTLIINATQVLPNLGGSRNAKIQITGNVESLTFNNTENNNTEYAGTITGENETAWSGGQFIKTGSGELTLSYWGQFNVVDSSLTVEEGTLKLAAANIFNTPSVTVNSGGKIVASANQTFKNLHGSGDIEILGSADVNSSYDKVIVDGVERYHEISGRLLGSGEFEKQGEGTLILSGANELTGFIRIDYGKIIFKGDAIGCNEKIEGSAIPDTNRKVGDVEFYTEGTKFICIPDDSKHILVKSIEKTGDSDSILQIYEGGAGCVRAESFVISSGRVDYGGYFQSLPPEGQALGIFDVKGGTTFSPGVTIDEHKEVSDTIGRITISNEARLKIEENALALFEFDAYNETGLKFDNVVFEHENSTFVAANGTIDLAFLSNDAWKWAKEGAEYWIVNDHDFNHIPEGETRNYDNWLRDTYKDYFSLVGRYDGLYLVGKGAPEPPSYLVPEPSSWILLLGSMVTFLMYLRKKQG